MSSESEAAAREDSRKAKPPKRSNRRAQAKDVCDSRRQGLERRSARPKPSEELSIQSARFAQQTVSGRLSQRRGGPDRKKRRVGCVDMDATDGAIQNLLSEN